MLNSTPARKRANLVCSSGHKPIGSRSSRFKLKYCFLIQIILHIENLRLTSRNNRHEFSIFFAAPLKINFAIFLSRHANFQVNCSIEYTCKYSVAPSLLCDINWHLMIILHYFIIHNFIIQREKLND